MSLAVIGVDVGGTNTDAVVVLENKVVGWSKHLTSNDVTSGVVNAVKGAISDALKSGYEGRICQMNIGTTHFVNAVIQRRNLSRVAVIRLCGPATRTLPPFANFPKDLKKAVASLIFMVDGGYQYDGSEIYPVNYEQISKSLEEIYSENIRNIVISGVFSPVRYDQENQVKKYILEKYPDFSITVSHEIGTMNLLERENAAILNECLKKLCNETVRKFENAFQELDLVCPIYFTQNDGTILSATQVQNFPVFTFSSGPTNSMRGAVLLSGIANGIVLDIGGTSTDIGLIQEGFPREASTEIKVGGVSTNFRMPDVICEGLGGGSIVSETMDQIGPISVGNNIMTMAKVFGGNTLTASDVAVAAGLAEFGRPDLVSFLQEDQIETFLKTIHSKIEDLVEKIKVSADDIPLIVVGGGSIIVDVEKPIKGINRIIKPNNFSVANAVGAAFSQVGGSVDEVMSVSGSWNDLVTTAREKASSIAISNGASAQSINIVSQSIIPLLYLPGNVMRVQIKAVGDLDKKFNQKVSPNLIDFINLIERNGPDAVSVDPQENVKVEMKNNEDDLDTLQPSEPYINPTTGEWELSKWDVECMAIGAGILGCGGGGNPYLGRLLLLRKLEEGKVPRVIHPDRLLKQSRPDDIALAVAFYGSPIAASEKMPSGNESTHAVNCLQDLHVNRLFQNGEIHNHDGVTVQEENGVTFIDDYRVSEANELDTFIGIGDYKIACIYSMEIGGLNAIEPLIFGAENNIPIADVDGIGRAVPELQMTCPFILDPSSVYPAVLTDVRGDASIILQGETVKKCEDHFRKTVMRYGCDALLASSGLKVAAMRKYCVGGSLSRCWRIGNVVMTSKYDNSSPFNKLVQQEQGKILCFGKVVDVKRKTVDGFSRGQIVISESNDTSESTICIEFQNEFLLATRQSHGCKEVLATVPDILTIVDHDTCMPITSDLVEYGQRVAVLLLSPPTLITSEKVLDVIGPQAFGYDVKYNRDDNMNFKETYIPLP